MTQTTREQCTTTAPPPISCSGICHTKVFIYCDEGPPILRGTQSLLEDGEVAMALSNRGSATVAPGGVKTRRSQQTTPAFERR